VTPANLLYNAVATPSELHRYLAAGAPWCSLPGRCPASLPDRSSVRNWAVHLDRAAKTIL